MESSSNPVTNAPAPKRGMPSGVLVVRALTDESARLYLRNLTIRNQAGDTLFSPASVSGLAVRYQDSSMLRTPAEFQEGLGLSYVDAAYEQRNGRQPFLPTDDHIVIMRFCLDNPQRLSTPYGGPTAADREAWGGSTYYAPPFTGRGMTPSRAHMIPEFCLADGTRVPDRADILLQDRAGSTLLLGSYDRQAGTWRRTVECGAWLSLADSPTGAAAFAAPEHVLRAQVADGMYAQWRGVSYPRTGCNYDDTVYLQMPNVDSIPPGYSPLWNGGSVIPVPAHEVENSMELLTTFGWGGRTYSRGDIHPDGRIELTVSGITPEQAADNGWTAAYERGHYVRSVALGEIADPRQELIQIPVTGPR